MTALALLGAARSGEELRIADIRDLDAVTEVLASSAHVTGLYPPAAGGGLLVVIADERLAVRPR